VELAPAQLFYRYTLSEILRLLDRDDRSVAVLRRAVEAAPRIGQTRLHLARAHLRAGRPDSAAAQLLAGGAAADAAADTLLMRRLLAELPPEDDRVPEIQGER
jgi:predicted Zn-dependent protease